MRRFEFLALDGKQLWIRYVWVGQRWIIYHEEGGIFGRPGQPDCWRLRLGGRLKDGDLMELTDMGEEIVPMLLASHVALHSLLFPRIIAYLNVGDGGHGVAVQWQRLAKLMGWRKQNVNHHHVSFAAARLALKYMGHSSG